MFEMSSRVAQSQDSEVSEGVRPTPGPTDMTLSVSLGEESMTTVHSLFYLLGVQYRFLDGRDAPPVYLNPPRMPVLARLEGGGASGRCG